MKVIPYGLVLIIPLIIAGCVEKFTPEIHETQYLIVVNGSITNLPEVYTVRLSWSIPFGGKTSFPMAGCNVTVHDDLGHIYQFSESSTPGIYHSDKTTFQGVVGRKYTLCINTLNATPAHYSYESLPMEMKPVPPIDTLFYEKVLIKEAAPITDPLEGCQIYLNAYEPNGDCRFYRWDYTETWEFEIPYEIVDNRICWISNSSGNIDVKNTLALSEDRVSRHPLLFISNETDRLSKRYSMIVSQYSLSENEYAYWEKIKDISQDAGSLYDKIPFSIQANLFCIEDPHEQVLGYFSVSAKTSKRIFIDEPFRGLVNPYKECPSDTLWGFGLDSASLSHIAGLNEYVWIIEAYRQDEIMYLVITKDHRCADCSLRGTTTRPEFWEDFK
jgi:hypothetical protein